MKSSQSHTHFHLPRLLPHELRLAYLPAPSVRIHYDLSSLFLSWRFTILIDRIRPIVSVEMRRTRVTLTIPNWRASSSPINLTFTGITFATVVIAISPVAIKVTRLRLRHDYCYRYVCTVKSVSFDTIALQTILDTSLFIQLSNWNLPSLSSIVLNIFAKIVVSIFIGVLRLPYRYHLYSRNSRL